MNPGRPIGEVLAWLWHEDRTTLVITVAELLAEARRHQPKDQHPFRFDDLAHGIRDDLPRGLDRDEADQMIDYLEAEMPTALGSELNP